MFASISVTTYNRKKFSKFCVETIHERTPRREHELVVIDNGSSDGTDEMLKKYHKSGTIDKLVLNHFNNLGLAINDAWKLASPNTEWLVVLSNDHFCMDEWFKNFKLIIDSDLKPDYIFTVLRPWGFHLRKALKTTNGGSFVLHRGWKSSFPFGGGLAIKKSIVDKHNIQFLTGEGVWGNKGRGVSIYSVVCKELHSLGLKYVELGKPCVLAQDTELRNPEYRKYYKRTYGMRGRMKSLIAAQSRGGPTLYPDEYYAGSGYKIGKHYRNQLRRINVPKYRGQV